jgi:murein DD-endopeptidase MepM/ murein hydrolase activator NlpD
MAQAILETGWGKSVPKDKTSGSYSYNLFGIKWSGSGSYVVCTTWEVENGKTISIDARFQAYPSFEDSFKGHSQLLSNPRYASAMKVRNDPREFARQIQADGYATDPDYAKKLISIMESNGLLTLQTSQAPDTVPAPNGQANFDGGVLAVGQIQNPLPGTTRAKNDGGYDADSGLDILVPVGTQAFAGADGDLIYAEYGHTPWGTTENVGIDTPHSALIKLASPLTVDQTTYNFIWYTHLSALDMNLADGSPPIRVKAGDKVGKTGIGNKVPHLHFGVVQDRAQTVTLPQRRVADVIWPAEALPVPVAKPARTVVLSDGNGTRSAIDCNPSETGGVTRVDLRPVMDALKVVIQVTDSSVVLIPAPN